MNSDEFFLKKVDFLPKIEPLLCHFQFELMVEIYMSKEYRNFNLQLPNDPFLMT